MERAHSSEDPVVKAALPLAAVLSILLASSLGSTQADKGTEEPLAKRVKTAIDKGVAFLTKKSQRDDGSWEAKVELSVSHTGGQTALALLALLNAGLTADNDAVKKGLDYLRKVDKPSTYVRSLQTMALVEAGRPQDVEKIRNNVKHLLSIVFTDDQGNLRGWGYDQNGLRDSPDNSNTQYALLALWVARQSGVDVDALWATQSKDRRKFWEQVRDFYARTQSKAGGWGYTPSGEAGGLTPGDRLTMTTAALSGLYMAQMELTSGRENLDPVTICGQYEENQALARGLAWIYSPPPKGVDRFQLNPDGTTFYNLYGIERLGRLSGLRFLGPHDWYREGCAWLVGKQHADGTWSINSRYDAYPNLSTSFALLFLSKGRTPILVSKVMDGPEPRQGNDQDWNRRRNDLRHLVDFASTKLFKKAVLGWQNLDIAKAAQRVEGEDAEETLRRVTSEMLQAPVLYLIGHESPDDRLTGVEKKLLKRYLENGGFLLGVACCGSKQFTAGFTKLCETLYPNSELTPLPEDHAVWHLPFKVPPGSFGLRGIQSGCKTTVVLATENLCGYWEINRRTGEGEKAFLLGANLIAYATGMVPPEPRLTLKPVTVAANDPPLSIPPRGYFKVGQLISKVGEEADWKPAPEAMSHLMQHLREQVGLEVVLKTANLPITHKDLVDYKFLYMHGRKEFTFGKDQLKNLRFNLKNGGLLLADACCGKEAFDKAFRAFIHDLFPKEEFPEGKAPDLVTIPHDDPLFSAELNGVKLDENSIQCREERGKEPRRMRPALEGVKIGKRWVVIYSKYDIGCALEKHQSGDCRGYSYESALLLARAAVLYQFRP
jgi:hypothetical protein